VGAEYLFDGASAVLLAYDPLKPHTLVAAAARFQELCPASHRHKCTVIPVIVLPDAAEGPNRRRGLAKVRKTSS
jgi:hypothetical protein